MTTIILIIYVLSVILTWIIYKLHAIKDPGIIGGGFIFMMFIPIINILTFIALLICLIQEYTENHSNFGGKVVKFFKLDK